MNQLILNVVVFLVVGGSSIKNLLNIFGLSKSVYTNMPTRVIALIASLLLAIGSGLFLILLVTQPAFSLDKMNQLLGW